MMRILYKIRRTCAQRNFVALLLAAAGMLLANVPLARAQEPFASMDFTVGAIYPAETAGGIYLGATLRKPFAQSGAFKWELGAGAGVSHRNDDRLAVVSYAGVLADPDIMPAADISFSRTLVPAMAELSCKLSFLEMNLPNFPFVGWLSRTSVRKVSGLRDMGLVLRPRAIYNWLWSEEEFSGSVAAPQTSGATTPVTVSDSRRYTGWGWGAEFGMYIITTSNVSSMFSVSYQNANVKREQGEDQLFLPANPEVDLDGFGFSFSVGFGF